jgi:hypothetical protein
MDVRFVIEDTMHENLRRRPGYRKTGYILVDGEDMGISLVYGNTENACKRKLKEELMDKRDIAKENYDLACEILESIG